MTAVSLRPADATHPQDWPRLAAWLADHGRHLDLSQPIRQFSGGVANLNYLVRIDGARAVVRRPPPGLIADGASDMGREWRVLSALSSAFYLAPQPYFFCDDSTVLGAPFLILEYRPGVAIGPTLPTELVGRAEAPDLLVGELVGAMAALHRVDIERVGLSALGRPDGFLGRQVDGWIRRARVAYGGEAPRSMETVLKWLENNSAGADGPAVLLHGDLKLDNLLIDPASLTAVGLIDWDMATRGDAYFDLAVLLSYWVGHEDPEPVQRIAQVPSLQPGFPSRRALAERYFAATGQPVVDIGFHLTLARLRLAIAWQQLYRLHKQGALADPRYSSFNNTASAVLDWTADTLSAPPL
jgi:aminoglycoside phosphotransferase (APT) family kinase protein